MRTSSTHLRRLDAVLTAGRAWLVAKRRWDASVETTEVDRLKSSWRTLQAAEERLAGALEELDPGTQPFAPYLVSARDQARAADQHDIQVRLK